MNLVHYERFLDCEARGLKREAKQAVEDFIASFCDDADIQAWVWSYLPQLRTNRHSRLRHELFERLIFPVLRRGYEADDFESLLWLGRLIQNVYQTRTLHAELGWVTDAQLFRRCYAMNPASDEARMRLLDCQVNWLSFSAHEWPDVLLYGNSAASRDECDELREELAFLRGLDREARFTEFFNDFEEKLREYSVRTAP